MRESFKMFLVCIAAAIIYGIVHDQFTARICMEYFTIFHPPVFVSRSPTLLAFGWGLIATWWVGALLGAPLAIAARAGSRPKLAANALVGSIARLLLTMAACAASFGIAGYVLTRHEIIFAPDWVTYLLLSRARSRFMADWWAHSASYVSGIVGGMVLCILTYRRRIRAPVPFNMDK
jgi:hypothetical protein